MSDTLSEKESRGLLLLSLIVETKMVKQKHPSIVDVEQRSPDIAKRMKTLGYEELSPDLLRAFIRSGEVPPLENDDLKLFGRTLKVCTGVM